MSARRRSKREEAAAIQRLNAALGIASRRDIARGSLAGVAVLAGLAAVLWLLVGAQGPVEETAGVVAGLGFVETENGSVPYASVDVDGRAARVELAPGRLCLVGDRVALRRRRALVGYRYSLTAEGCSRPAAR